MRRVASPSAVAVALALLLCVPSIAAQPAPVGFGGDLSASSLLVSGGSVSGPLSFLGVLDPAPGTTLRVEAASADVEVHYQPYRKPAVVGVDTYTGDDRTRVRGPFHHEDVRALSVRVGVESFVQAEGTEGPGGPPTADAEVPAHSVVAREALRFERPGHTGSEWMPHREGPWPGLEASPSDGLIILRGDVVLTFYDLDLRLRDRDGVETYETGHVPDDGDRDDVRPVEEGEQRRVVVTLRDAVVHLRPAGAPALAHLGEAAVVADGAAALLGARGTLRVGSARVPVGDDLRFDAAWTGTLAPDGGRVAASLSGSARSLSVDGAGIDLAATAPEPPLASTAWSWLAPLLLVLLGLPAAASHAARVRRLDPDALVCAAGWELDAGRPRRAAAWSRRALHRDASDADAAAIRTVALYRRGRHAEAVAWLDAFIAAHGDPSGELTVLLGLGRLETDGSGAAARTLRPALAADPSLRRLLEAPDA